MATIRSTRRLSQAVLTYRGIEEKMIEIRIERVEKEEEESWLSELYGWDFDRYQIFNKKKDK